MKLLIENFKKYLHEQDEAPTERSRGVDLTRRTVDSEGRVPLVVHLQGYYADVREYETGKTIKIIKKFRPQQMADEIFKLLPAIKALYIGDQRYDSEELLQHKPMEVMQLVVDRCKEGCR